MVKRIYVPLPDKEARKTLIKHLLQKQTTSSNNKTKDSSIFSTIFSGIINIYCMHVHTYMIKRYLRICYLNNEVTNYIIRQL